MHNEWGPAVPSMHETQKIGDVLLVRHDVTVKRRRDVVLSKPEMVFGDYRRRPFNCRLVPDQGNDVQRAGLFNGFVQARERANVNHRS